MKRILNKWQLHWRFERDFMRGSRLGWRMVEFGILKFRSFPGEGSVIEKKHYSGFLLAFFVWFPIDF